MRRYRPEEEDPSVALPAGMVPYPREWRPSLRRSWRPIRPSCMAIVEGRMCGAPADYMITRGSARIGAGSSGQETYACADHLRRISARRIQSSRPALRVTRLDPRMWEDRS